MHCLNPTYDKAVILPPYNTLWAQVIRRGNPPRIVTTGITVEYSIEKNTYSYGKRDYRQFWDNADKLFSPDLLLGLTHDTGLNLEDPSIHSGLSGRMVLKVNHFQADGIPLTPVDDAGNWNPYQVALITVRDIDGAVLATTRATVPTSDEINCGKCHETDPLRDVLLDHDANEGTQLDAQKPILCAQCHGSPALGVAGPGSSGRYLSEVIHLFHSTISGVPTCYDCHPGATTRCNRSIPHASSDGNCTTCHGEIGEVGSSVADGRVPWVSEPGCDAVECHSPSIPEVDTGATLYRKSLGHGGVYCAGCHGSPHATVPSSQSSDNYQAIQYQGTAKSLGSCGVCHEGSRGEGLEEFREAHGGDRATACAVCHTAAPSTDTEEWPHGFKWKNR